MINDQYLFYVEYGSPQWPAEPFPRSVKAVACHDIWHSFKELYKIPLDQLHPDTAASNNCEQYIKAAKIISLLDGDLVARLVVLPKESGEISQHVYLAIKPTLKDKLEQGGIKADFRGGPDTEGLYFTIAVRSEDGTYLQHTTSGAKLFSETVPRIHDPSSGLLPQPYCLMFNSLDLNQASVVGGNVQYQAISREHYLMNATEALLMLLKTPTEHFDKEAAFENDLSHYYIKAGISKTYEEVMLAETVSVKPLLEDWTLRDEKETGRMLAIDTQYLPLLTNLGFKKDDILSFPSTHVVRLDEWDVEKNRLTPTDTFAQVLENMHSHPQAQVPVYPYMGVFILAFYHPSINPDRIMRVAQKEMIIHGQDILPMLSRMLTRNLTTYNAALAMENNLPNYALHCSIRNADNKFLINIGLPSNIGLDADPGLYFGIDKSFLNDPVIAQLFPQQLSQGMGADWITNGSMQYAKIGYYKDNEIVSTPGFSKFGQLLVMHHLDQLIINCPERKTVQPEAIIADNNLQYRQDWELKHPDGRLQSFSHYLPVNSIEHGLGMLKHLPSFLFETDFLQEVGVPLKFISGNILEGPHAHVVVSKQRHPSKNGHYLYEPNQEQMSKEFKKAYAAFEQNYSQFRTLEEKATKKKDPRPRVIQPEKKETNKGQGIG